MEVRKRKNSSDGGASVNAGDDRTPSSVSSTSDRTVRSKRRIFLLRLAFRVIWLLDMGVEERNTTYVIYGQRDSSFFCFLIRLYTVFCYFSTVSKSPRLIQSIFSALGDLYLYKLSDALYGDDVASWYLYPFYAPY
ncbi:hypothetical protein F2Q70_00007433 [Brassica cretica]|uniref:Uncharacterized protein n=1 Tax=Brassica cretica TaxID=69181 RepID=A0A8S9LV32_BRACR|nr:hypothetical protein F2Q70_00007433 [Brassica cretica]